MFFFPAKHGETVILKIVEAEELYIIINSRSSMPSSTDLPWAGGQKNT